MECCWTVNEIFGGNSEEDPPVPIPNTEVKLFSADGTAWVTMWESRSPPNPLIKPLGEYFAKGLFAFALFAFVFGQQQRRGSTRTHHEHGSFPPLSPLRSNRYGSLFRVACENGIKTYSRFHVSLTSRPSRSVKEEGPALHRLRYCMGDSMGVEIAAESLRQRLNRFFSG